MNDAPSPFETSTHAEPSRPGAWGKRVKTPAPAQKEVPSLERVVSSFEDGKSVPLPTRKSNPTQSEPPPSHSPFVASAPGAVLATQNVSEVQELRASVWSHVLPLVLALFYGYYHFIRHFWQYVTARNGRAPSTESLLLLGIFGCYGIYSIGKAVYHRWAASRSLLRADAQGVTLHNEKRHTFVLWDQIDHYTETVEQPGKVALFSLRDASDNVVLEWPQAWPATFAPAKNAEAFHAYLRSRVPNRRLEMAEMTEWSAAQTFDELRPGETIKVSHSSLAERRAATTAIGMLVFSLVLMMASALVGEWLLITGIWFLVMWLFLLLWHLVLPCSIALDERGLTLQRGTKRRNMEWTEIARLVETKGRLAGSVELYGRADQRLVLPDASLWRGSEALRAYRVLKRRTSNETLTVF